MDPFEQLGVRAVVNAAGTLTRLGGQLMAPEVVGAMVEASRRHVRMEELHDRAGAVLAEATGAEAGYATPGAAAGITLGVAACIAGYDLDRMERMPLVLPEGAPLEVVVQRAHRNAYDHAVRAAGVRLTDVGWAGNPGVGRNHAWALEAAIGPRTVAVYCLVTAPGVALALDRVCEIAHAKGVPVIVDAAASLPPAANLRRFIAEGADLVVYSGGKALGGPQASGMLVGRQDLIASVALQNQDMDVHPATWSGRSRFIESGLLAGPPNQGFGRGFKIGKEEIVGLVTALRRYLALDHDAVAAGWRARCTTMAAALGEVEGLEVTIVEPEHRPVPQVEIRLERDMPLDVFELLRRAAAGDPPIFLSESGADRGVAAIVPSCLRPEDDDLVVRAVRRIVRSTA